MYHLLPMNQTKSSPLVQQLVMDLPAQPGKAECAPLSVQATGTVNAPNADSEKSPCTKAFTPHVKVSNVLGHAPAPETFMGQMQHEPFEH